MKKSKAQKYLSSFFEFYTYDVKKNLAARWGLLWSLIFTISSLVFHYLHDYTTIYPQHLSLHWLLTFMPFIFFPLIGATGTLEVKENLEKSQQLKFSEMRYKTLVNNLPEIVYSSSPADKFKIEFISPQIQDFCGYKAEDFYSSPDTFIKIIHPDDLQLVLRKNKNIIRDIQLEYRIIHRDSKQCRYVIDHSILVKEDDITIGIEGIIIDLTNEVQAKQRLKALTRELINAQEMERKRIAKELHDEVGQALLAIKVNLNLLEKNCRANYPKLETLTKKAYSIANSLSADLKGISASLIPSIVNDLGNDLGNDTTLNHHIEEFKKLANLLEEAEKSSSLETENISKNIYSIVDMLIIDLRRISLDLRPSMLDNLGLDTTLRWYINEFKKRSSTIDVKFAISGIKNRLPAEIEVALYRVIQEALTNIVKHASADKVKITVKGENKKIDIYIEDNGLGFDIEKAFNPDTSGISFGIMSMQERVKNLGGDFKISSTKGKGTKLSLSVPLNV